MKPVNKKDNRYFQYTVTVALNYEQIKKDPQRITKIKPFINKCNREGITFLSQKDDSRKFEQNNVTIALNILYANKEKICSAYVSKHNSNREKKIIILMIPNGEKVKNLSVLLRGITSKHYGNFYYLNRLHSFRIKNKLELHKNVCENKDF